MRLQIMSDLHLEMHADAGAEFVRGLDPTGVDLLVLAGDIASARDFEGLAGAFEPFAEKYPRILYVPGNHEYYRTSPAEAARNLARLTETFPAVVVPANAAVVIAGQRFIAGTMWFRADPAAERYKRFMNDFAVIRGLEPWVYDENAAFERTLGGELAPGDVVVTHHLPAPESISPRFVDSPLNAFFLCDVSDLVRARRPQLWIHGHTHDRCDYRLGDTRVVANPLGYPTELRSLAVFDQALTVDVP